MDFSNPQNPLIFSHPLGTFTRTTPIQWTPAQVSRITHFFFTPRVQQHLFEFQREQQQSNNGSSPFTHFSIPDSLFSELGFATLSSQTTNFSGENVAEMVKDKIRDAMSALLERLRENENPGADVDMKSEPSASRVPKHANVNTGMAEPAQRTSSSSKGEGNSSGGSGLLEQLRRSIKSTASPDPSLDPNAGHGHGPSPSSSKLRFMHSVSEPVGPAGYFSPLSKLNFMPPSFATDKKTSVDDIDQLISSSKPATQPRIKKEEDQQGGRSSMTSVDEPGRSGNKESSMDFEMMYPGYPLSSTSHVWKKEESKGADDFPYHLFPGYGGSEVGPGPGAEAGRAETVTSTQLIPEIKGKGKMKERGEEKEEEEDGGDGNWDGDEDEVDTPPPPAAASASASKQSKETARKAKAVQAGIEAYRRQSNLRSSEAADTSAKTRSGTPFRSTATPKVSHAAHTKVLHTSTGDAEAVAAAQHKMQDGNEVVDPMAMYARFLAREKELDKQVNALSLLLGEVELTESKKVQE
ncbi:hypothetical protein MBM_07481 [Drepanopeziza brunnea f. sp. 'multigermtubi' MB_m1]|uniref:Uncharacterized protein n=1 Tax=Marssonina brunnea f. sp. multigermtubi (strain MB_m1) TaxID=1072389 RepID=K1WN06_MARBU|nr:uncharacterized protein MBM_07481 [Drepanopeziza brunnea f. sp. 'multigermtubi' MB_m1]EKD14251.1 hypothetical protein MBM_07481 [Drepanopeziza brunnea f. sp. 'multigermtubi' MB_m1]